MEKVKTNNITPESGFDKKKEINEERSGQQEINF